MRSSLILMPCFKVFVISAPAESHNTGQNGYGIGLLLLLDKVEFYSESLAKKAAAFFKVSRSNRSFLTYWRSRSYSPF